MSASRTRVAAIAVVLVVLALVGLAGWRNLTPASTPDVRVATSTTGSPSTPKSSAPVAPMPATPVGPDLGPAGAGSAKAAAIDGGTAAPSFDIVRVEPGGDALLAGRSKPNATVALVAGGAVVAETKADAGGNFVMTPPPLKPGDYALSLREGQGAATTPSKQSVVVSVPASKTQPVVVAMAEPGKATTILSAPPEAKGSASPSAAPASASHQTATPGSAAPATLAIRSVELENGSGLFASGVAPPGTDVRIYLNDSRVADVVAAAVGRWTVTIHKGLAAGRYAVRADSLKPDRSVEARVEVPFDVPVPMTAKAEASVAEPAPEIVPAKMADAAPQRSSPDATATPQASPADVVVDEVQTELVSRGDNLWRISRHRLGHGTRYTEIYAANAGQIRDPKLVYPGQVFVLPHQ